MKLDRPVLDMIAFPVEWCSHIRFADGKPSMNAVIILADIVGEACDQPEQPLQRNRSYYQKRFGLSNQQVKDALNLLESFGLIAVEIVALEVAPNGETRASVPYIHVFFDKINAITAQGE